MTVELAKSKGFKISRKYHIGREEKVLDPCDLCHYSHYEWDLSSCRMML